MTASFASIRFDYPDDLRVIELAPVV